MITEVGAAPTSTAPIPPRLYRTMFDDAGKPKIGQKRCMLGVRPPPPVGTRILPGMPRPDVGIESNGDVILDRRGMSVFRSLADLCADLKLVPLHLASKIRGAAGPSGAHIWATGAGPFVSGAVAPALVLHAPGGPHGNICPAHSMSLATFQQELANTPTSWHIDEP
jgi:hypothetical protein